MTSEIRLRLIHAGNAAGFLLVSGTILALGLRGPLDPFYAFVLQPALLLLAAIGMRAIDAMMTRAQVTKGLFEVPSSEIKVPSPESRVPCCGEA